MPGHVTSANPTSRSPVADKRDGAVAQPRCIDSARLLEGGRTLLIEHHGELYHLRVTRNDKLILTK